MSNPTHLGFNISTLAIFTLPRYHEPRRHPESYIREVKGRSVNPSPNEIDYAVRVAAGNFLRPSDPAVVLMIANGAIHIGCSVTCTASLIVHCFRES